MDFDPITTDLVDDADYPADTLGIVFESHGAKLNGVLYQAAGSAQHALIILLHGFPGHERNIDLAQILRRAGWHTLVFHYRGAWGSEGDYRFAHVLEDVHSALSYFRQEAVAAEYRIDPTRIITIGHSIGGWASLMAAAHGWVEAAASIAGVNVGWWGAMIQAEPEMVRPMVQSLFAENLDPLQGVTADDLLNEVCDNAANWQLVDLAPQLSQKKLLLLAGKRDQLITAFDHHLPVVKALEQAGAAHLTHAMLKTNHGFDNQRVELARQILDWLDTI